jgi:leucyl-tRNA---protein transferase
LDNAISAVYNFFDPDEPRSSLGTFGILAEIEYARRCGLRWVYLGYWLPGYPGMDYKTRFQPA